MRWFIPRYQVNMDEVLDPNLNNYPNFNTFFTRELKPGVRPITEVANGLACPADGALYQLGDIEGDTLIEAKGHNFSLTTLLGGDAQRAAPFVGGHYTTIYLSPKDYHRVHMPYTGVLHEMIHVPGRLYSVNPRTTRTIPGVFARNERVVSIFETEYGPMAVILVGAMFVGSIETVWAGCLTDTPIYSPQVTRYNTEAEERIELKKGDELGRFNMGSTVILVFAKDRIKWENSLQTGQTTQLGQLLVTCKAQTCHEPIARRQSPTWTWCRPYRHD